VRVSRRSAGLGDEAMDPRRIKGRVKVGDTVPNFTLPSQVGEQVSLKNFIGERPIVLSSILKTILLAAPSRLVPSGMITRDLGSSMLRSSG